MNSHNSLVINYLKRVSYRINYTTPSYLWSWWDSNPRPNRETIRFLHAYSSLRFSRYDKTWTTNHTLIL